MAVDAVVVVVVDSAVVVGIVPLDEVIPTVVDDSVWS